MRFRGLLAAGLLAAWTASSAFGQSHLIRSYTEDDGLPSSMVHGVVQAPDGLIWFATRSGVAAHDGLNWQVFGAAEGLSGDIYSHIAVDERGTIWALARMPRPIVSRYENGRWTPLPAAPLSSETGQATALAACRPGGEPRIVLGTAVGGLLIFERNAWSRLAGPDGLPSLEITGLAVDAGVIYAATRSGLVRLDGDKAVALTRGSDGRGTPLLGLAMERLASGVRLWLLGAGRLSTWRNGELATAFDSAPFYVNPIYPGLFGAPDGSGGLVYGNPTGMFHFARLEGSVRRLGLAEGLIAEGGTGVVRDREGNIWISGLRGLNKISSFRFANFRKAQGLLEDEVTAILEAAPGAYVFGHGAGLSFFDGRAFTTRAFVLPAGIGAAEIRVQELCKDRTGAVWMAASGLGAARIRPGGEIRWFRAAEGVAGAARSVAEDASGRLLLLDNEGLKVFRDNRFVPAPEKVPLSSRRIVIDADGSLLLPQFSLGLVRVSGSDVRRLVSDGDPEADNVYSVRRDSRGVLWIGTRGGLCVAAGEKIASFAAAGFALRRPVYTILEDGRGRMWFGTDNGVVLWDGMKARTFTRHQGFVGQETNRAASIVDHAGKVWIGSDLGLSRYDEEFDVDPASLPPPLVSLRDVETADGIRPLGAAPVSFPSGVNTLTFRFRGVSFIDEEALRYRCRLEGFDEDWSAPFGAARPEARYTNLPRGRYRFAVQAASTADVWSRAVVSGPLLVRGPFWRSWWFIGLCIIVAGFVLQAALSAASVRRRARELEAKVVERTGELRASLAEKEVLLREIHHRVKNNLQIVASLLYLQSRGLPEPVRHLFQESRDRLKTMALIHENLYRSPDLSRIDVPGYFRTLAEAIFGTLGAEHIAVRLELKLAPGSLEAESAVTCGLILNELVTNALKYAFPGGRTGTVGVEFEETSPGRYRFEVWDDGRGLPPALDVRAAETLGLKLVDGLVRQLGGTLEVGPPPGARFTIRFGGK